MVPHFAHKCKAKTAHKAGVTVGADMSSSNYGRQEILAFQGMLYSVLIGTPICLGLCITPLLRKLQRQYLLAAPPRAAKQVDMFSRVSPQSAAV